MTSSCSDSKCSSCPASACNDYIVEIKNEKNSEHEITTTTISQHTSETLTKENAIQSTKIAIIDEEKCIGCTQCAKVCPTKAIVGASNCKHTVLTKDCIGCELCTSLCPINCIKMATVDKVEEYQETDINKETKEQNFTLELSNRAKETLASKQKYIQNIINKK